MVLSARLLFWSLVELNIMTVPNGGRFETYYKEKQKRLTLAKESSLNSSLNS